MKNNLRSKKVSTGHFQISIDIEDEQFSTVTTNTMAIDAAFDEDYNGSGRVYESSEEAQNALIREIRNENGLD